MLNKYTFRLKNYRAILDADIKLDGLTILSGENGCGKSTTTRWIYFILEMVSNFEQYAFADYKDELLQVINKLESIRRDVSIYSPMILPNMYKLRSRLAMLDINNQDEIAALDLLLEDSIGKLADALAKYFNSSKDSARKQRLLAYIEMPTYDEKTFIADVMQKINGCYDNFQKSCEQRCLTSMWTFIHKYFDEKLDIPKNIQFAEDNVELISNKQFGHLFGIDKCIYVDTPMALARMNDTDNSFWRQLRNLMFKKREGELSIEAKKLIIQIRNIIGGTVIVDDNSIDDDELRYVRSDNHLNIPIEETATGLKSFAYILRLLENGHLDSQTLLIIDEPEVHMHPQWIVEFARVLVLLHKTIGVRVLITSHNPDMVAAIHEISKSMNVETNTNFYLAVQDDKSKNQYSFSCLHQEIAPIFDSFNIALSRIDQYGTHI